MLQNLGAVQSRLQQGHTVDWHELSRARNEMNTPTLGTHKKRLTF